MKIKDIVRVINLTNNKYLITILTLIFAVSAYSKGRIFGIVVDESNKPLVGATVKLNTVDSIFVDGVTSNTDGSFTIADVTDGDYIMNVSYIGYKAFSVAVRNLRADVNVDTVRLIPSARALKDVVVTGSGTIDEIDRQLIMPSRAQVEASTNGISLLEHLQLPGIHVNTFDNTITTLAGLGVQLRVNGVESTAQEIKAIRPTDVVRIEYHDMPGLRYGNVPAVLDFIVKYKNDGGSVSADLTNAVTTLGMGDYSTSAGYHSGKSSIKFVTDWSQNDFNWVRQENEEFNGGSAPISNTEVGAPTKAQSVDGNMSLAYNYQTDKDMLNITLRDNLNNTPHSMSDRRSVMSQEGNTYNVTDLQHSNDNSPSLDLYYQRQFNKNSTLFVDVVGTYIKTNSDRTYTMDDGVNPPNAVPSTVSGDKYSVIGEAIYEQAFHNAKLTLGLKHTQAYTDNTYGGSVDAKVNMTTAETYAYAEFMGKAHAFTYTGGLGLMRTYNNQEGNSQESYIFRPEFALSYEFSKSLTVRWNTYISGYSPALADLSNVSQQIDAYQVRRGNPDLKSVWYVSTTVMADWRSKYVSAQLFGRYSYDHKPLMESTLYEDGMYIRTMENHKGFQRLSAFLGLTIKPWKDYISIELSPFLNWYSGQGNDYAHSYSNWGLAGSVTGSYKHWQLMVDLSTSYYVLWGETLTKDQNDHSIALGYNTDKWGVQVRWLNPFVSRYVDEEKNLSALAPYYEYAYNTAQCHAVLLNFSLNLDFGKKVNSANKRIFNSDNDSGVMSGRQ